jgi:hypothetical protein
MYSVKKGAAGAAKTGVQNKKRSSSQKPPRPVAANAAGAAAGETSVTDPRLLEELKLKQALNMPLGPPPGIPNPDSTAQMKAMLGITGAPSGKLPQPSVTDPRKLDELKIKRLFNIPAGPPPGFESPQFGAGSSSQVPAAPQPSLAELLEFPWQPSELELMRSSSQTQAPANSQTDLQMLLQFPWQLPGAGK